MDISQRVELIGLFYENRRSVSQCLRVYRVLHGRDAGPSETAVYNLIKKFQETGSVHDAPRPGCPRRARTKKNINAVATNVAINPTTSTRRRAKKLGLSESTLRRILHEDLNTAVRNQPCLLLLPKT